MLCVAAAFVILPGGDGDEHGDGHTIHIRFVSDRSLRGAPRPRLRPPWLTPVLFLPFFLGGLPTLRPLACGELDSLPQGGSNSRRRPLPHTLPTALPFFFFSTMAAGTMMGKRRSSELSMTPVSGAGAVAAPPPSGSRGPTKRARRPTSWSTGALDVRAALGSGVAGFARLPTRLATLSALGVTEAHVAALYTGLGGDTDALLRLVDGNTYASGVLGVLRDASSAGTSLTTLNVRAHSWSVGPAASVVGAFERHVGAARPWAVGVLRWVVATAFAAEGSVGITALEGGGVRDVLLREWWAMYGPRLGGGGGEALGSRPPPPVLLIVTGGVSGRSFLIPSLGQRA